MNEKLLRIQNGSKIFNANTILDKVGLEIQKGEFVALLGPSGSGKTTLLRLLAGLETWSQGSFSETRNQHSSFVFQEPNLLSWRTLLENLRLPLELKQSAIDQQLLRQALKLVKLENAEKLLPHELSGGMKMRASIARALVTQPELLFMDEPFSALDEPTREDLQDQLRSIWESQSTTIVFVTHSLSEATFLANRIVILGGKPATVIHDFEINLPRQRQSSLRSSEDFFRELKKVRSLFYSSHLESTPQ